MHNQVGKFIVKTESVSFAPLKLRKAVHPTAPSASLRHKQARLTGLQLIHTAGDNSKSPRSPALCLVNLGARARRDFGEQPVPECPEAGPIQISPRIIWTFKKKTEW